MGIFACKVNNGLIGERPAVERAAAQAGDGVGNGDIENNVLIDFGDGIRFFRGLYSVLMDGAGNGCAALARRGDRGVGAAAGNGSDSIAGAGPGERRAVGSAGDADGLAFAAQRERNGAARAGRAAVVCPCRQDNETQDHGQSQQQGEKFLHVIFILSFVGVCPRVGSLLTT